MVRDENDNSLFDEATQPAKEAYNTGKRIKGDIDKARDFLDRHQNGLNGNSETPSENSGQGNESSVPASEKTSENEGKTGENTSKNADATNGQPGNNFENSPNNGLNTGNNSTDTSGNPTEGAGGKEGPSHSDADTKGEKAPSPKENGGTGGFNPNGAGAEQGGTAMGVGGAESAGGAAASGGVAAGGGAAAGGAVASGGAAAGGAVAGGTAAGGAAAGAASGAAAGSAGGPIGAVAGAAVGLFGDKIVKAVIAILGCLLLLIVVICAAFPSVVSSPMFGLDEDTSYESSDYNTKTYNYADAEDADTSVPDAENPFRESIEEINDGGLKTILSEGKAKAASNALKSINKYISNSSLKLSTVSGLSESVTTIGDADNYDIVHYNIVYNDHAEVPDDDYTLTYIQSVYSVAQNNKAHSKLDTSIYTEADRMSEYYGTSAEDLYKKLKKKENSMFPVECTRSDLQSESKTIQVAEEYEEVTAVATTYTTVDTHSQISNMSNYTGYTSGRTYYTKTRTNTTKTAVQYSEVCSQQVKKKTGVTYYYYKLEKWTLRRSSLKWVASGVTYTSSDGTKYSTGSTLKMLPAGEQWVVVQLETPYKVQNYKTVTLYYKGSTKTLTPNTVTTTKTRLVDKQVTYKWYDITVTIKPFDEDVVWDAFFDMEVFTDQSNSNDVYYYDKETKTYYTYDDNLNAKNNAIGSQYNVHHGNVILWVSGLFAQTEYSTYSFSLQNNEDTLTSGDKIVKLNKKNIKGISCKTLEYMDTDETILDVVTAVHENLLDTIACSERHSATTEGTDPTEASQLSKNNIRWYHLADESSSLLKAKSGVTSSLDDVPAGTGENEEEIQNGFTNNFRNLFDTKYTWEITKVEFIKKGEYKVYFNDSDDDYEYWYNSDYWEYSSEFTNPLYEYEGKLYISSSFGMRIHPLSGVYKMHKGVDICRYGSSTGMNIHPTADGTVVGVGYGSSEGYYIKINHGNGYESRYYHMQTKALFSVGDKVTVADVVGYVGATGGVTGAHLHFEIRYNGTPVNPVLYCKALANL